VKDARDLGPLFDEAWRLIDEGRPEDALDAVESAPSNEPERICIEATALLELGELEDASAAIEDLEEMGLGEEPDVVWLRGELALARWDVEPASALFERFARDSRDAACLDRLAFCAELSGQLEEADALYAEAAARDPERFPLCPRLSREAFEAAIHAAIEDLPAPFQRALERAEVVVELVPPRELAAQTPAETPPDLFGLFVGASDLERSEDAPDLPPRIYLFQRNLERATRDHVELEDEIRVTLYHELGHMLGFDEEGVDEMGLG
jgi:predicted Zn-dependent protease with MMP-like domain